MKEIQLEIYTPSKSVYSGTVKSVTLPGELGSFQVLYNHAPIISSLVEGKVKIVNKENKEEVFKTGGGMVEVLKNKVLVLAESFENL